MKLWLVRRDLYVVGYDETDGVVVRAENEEEARKIAAGEAGDEGPGVWNDAALSTCEEVTVEGEAGRILASFNAG